jgi:hypothetical protein
LSALLSKKVSVERKKIIPQWVQEALEKRRSVKLINSYREICQWLEQKLGIIILMFQQSPPPESNPSEQGGQYLKKGLIWKLPSSLEELRVLIGEQLEKVGIEVITLIIRRKYILEALSVVGIKRIGIICNGWLRGISNGLLPILIWRRGRRAQFINIT